MSTFEDFMIDKAVKGAEREEKLRESCRALSARVVQLQDALRDLMRGYVSTLESARERILFYGGQCADVETMERGDPHLRKAHEVLEAK